MMLKAGPKDLRYQAESIGRQVMGGQDETVEVACACGQSHRFSREFVGRVAKCPRTGRRFRIPPHSATVTFLDEVYSIQDPSLSSPEPSIHPHDFHWNSVRPVQVEEDEDNAPWWRAWTLNWTHVLGIAFLVVIVFCFASFSLMVKESEKMNILTPEQRARRDAQRAKKEAFKEDRLALNLGKRLLDPHQREFIVSVCFGLPPEVFAITPAIVLERQVKTEGIECKDWNSPVARMVLREYADWDALRNFSHPDVVVASLRTHCYKYPNTVFAEGPCRQLTTCEKLADEKDSVPCRFDLRFPEQGAVLYVEDLAPPKTAEAEEGPTGGTEALTQTTPIPQSPDATATPEERARHCDALLEGLTSGKGTVDSQREIAAEVVRERYSCGSASIVGKLYEALRKHGVRFHRIDVPGPFGGRRTFEDVVWMNYKDLGKVGVVFRTGRLLFKDWQDPKAIAPFAGGADNLRYMVLEGGIIIASSTGKNITLDGLEPKDCEEARDAMKCLVLSEESFPSSAQSAP